MEIKNVKIQELIEYARNPRKNDEVVDRMVACIKEFGFKIPIVAKRDGTVIDGHLRLKAARKFGMEEVPVVIADDLSETQIKAFRLIANQSANWAEWDEELLKLELEDLQNLNFDLELTGFDLDEIEDFLRNKDEIEEDSFECEISEDTPTVSKLGDLWILGDHKLLCGDSTKSEDFQILLGDEKANMTFTDPPYNVNYGNNERDKREGKAARHILNDKLDDFYGFLQKVCKNINTHTNGAIYICMAATEIDTLKRAFEDTNGHFSTFIIWAKSHFAIGRSDYHRQYEPILYGWPSGISHHWYGDRTQSDLWECKITAKNDLHPTMKPTPLVARTISNSSKMKDIVLDPFCGSGTTIIACEELNRRARCIELDPKYVDVIIRRWQQHTNQKAILASTGKSFDEVLSCH